MKSRIIMHTPEPASGAALYVADLLKALLAAGETAVLFGPRNFAYAHQLRVAGAEIVSSGERNTLSAGLAARVIRNLNFFLSLCLRQIRLTGSSDIVHFQFPLYFPAGLVPFVLAKIQAHSVVYTAHDPVPHKWLLPRHLRFVERGCLRCAYGLSDRIVVHSPSAKDLLVRSFAQRPAKIAVIPHGATLRDPAPFPRGSNTLDLLIFGSIREDKGIELAIHAVQILNASKVQVRLHIAGVVANAREQSYWDRCMSSIKRAPAGISVDERFIQDEDIPELLAKCHAVLLPYKNFESDSGVAAVALASARAILATNTGSFSTLLQAADLGIPIESPSVESVQQAIQQGIHAGPDELNRKGLRGLAFARSMRSWEAIGRQTAGLYAGLWSTSIDLIREPEHG